MEIKEKLGAVEAILFASGEPVELYRLSQASGIDVGALPQLIRLLNERYDDCGSGICIKKLDSSYQMCTREEYAPNIRAVLETKKNTPLSNAAMMVRRSAGLINPFRTADSAFARNEANSAFGSNST